jgi:hypothetical protein
MSIIAAIMRASSRVVGAFSHRLIVGWLASPAPDPGSLPSARRKPGIVAQGVEVVGILVAAGDRQTRARRMSSSDGPPAKDRADRRCSGKPPANPHRALGLRQQQNPAVRGQPTTVEGGCDFLAPTAGNPK